jgi:hypothetical protein
MDAELDKVALCRRPARLLSRPEMRRSYTGSTNTSSWRSAGCREPRGRGGNVCFAKQNRKDQVDHVSFRYGSGTTRFTCLLSRQSGHGHTSARRDVPIPEIGGYAGSLDSAPVHACGFTANFGISPLRHAAIGSAADRANPAVASRVVPAMWGEKVTLGSESNGWLIGNGSG